MNTFKIGRRDAKKAEMKIEIMRAFIKRLEVDELNAIRVQDICDEVGISKVTFFNYFTSKEQVVDYFIHFWQYDLNYQIDKRKLNGREIIYELFTNVGGHPAFNHIINALMIFLIKLENYIMMEIHDYELYLWNAEAFNQGFRLTSIEDIIEKGLSDLSAIESEKQIMITNILSGFYGMFFLHKISYTNNIRDSYMSFLDSILPAKV